MTHTLDQAIAELIKILDDDETVIVFDMDSSEEWDDQLSDLMDVLFEAFEEEDNTDTETRELQEEDFVVALVEEQLTIEETNDPANIERWDLINELLACYLGPEGFEEMSQRSVNLDWVETILEESAGQSSVSLSIEPDSDEEDFVSAVEGFLKLLGGNTR